MPRTASDITWLIGRTPLIELRNLAPGAVRLLAKLECTNPSGSNKDRAVLGMIRHAEHHGFLEPGGILVECSGGDLGIAIAVIGRRLGYRVILTMPECMADDRGNLLRALGAEVEKTPSEHGMRGAMARAEKLAQELPGGLCLQAFTNRANAAVHAETTAREIWEDTDGKVDVVVVPVGTGGTAAGCLQFFREVKPSVQVIAVEPASCAVLSGSEPGPHGIPGLGAGFVPEILCASDLAEIVTVRDEDAVRGVRDLAARESVLVGPAGGAVLHAARRLADRKVMADRILVAVLPDSGERYLSHPAYRGLQPAGSRATGRETGEEAR